MVLPLFLLSDDKLSTSRTYETLIELVATNPVIKTAVPSTIKQTTSITKEDIQNTQTNVDTNSVNSTTADPEQNSLTSGQTASIEDAYITNIKRTLNKNKFYPITAKKLKQTGIVKVQFEINEHGHIINKSIIESSKYQSLNQAVTELLDRVRSFEPIPKEFGKKNWTFVLPVEFKI
jgi:protein TonB